MKKNILFLVLTAFLAFSASAQIAIRPYVGINSHNLTEDFSNTEWKSNVGYHLGADVQIGNKFYVQPGFQVDFVRNRFEVNGTEIDYDFKRSHLRIPVMVGYAFTGVDSNFGARLFTGPNASIVLNSESDEGLLDLDKEKLKSAVFGWNVGAGLDLSIFFVEAGYQFGLSKVFEEFDNYKNGSKDNYFYANAGFRIRF